MKKKAMEKEASTAGAHPSSTKTHPLESRRGVHPLDSQDSRPLNFPLDSRPAESFPQSRAKSPPESQEPLSKPSQVAMPLPILLLAACLLSLIVIVANYSVQFHLGDTPLTFGALTYPFSFLLLDVLSEKYRRKDLSKVIALAICIAFYPSYLSATSQIALASILAFCVSQPIDVAIFYAFKRFFPRLWWLRNGFSTLFAQLFDTLIFFSFAFWGVKSFNECVDMAAADYTIKAIVGAMNTPLFYLLAIRAKRIWRYLT